MNVLFYIPVKSEAGRTIHRLVDKFSPTVRTAVFQSVDDLLHNLRRPSCDGPTIVVLVAGDSGDLMNMISGGHLLSDTPIILILPDRKETTTAMGYRLYPRFLTYMDSNLSEVGAVLVKMIENYKKNAEPLRQ
jgi:hypothetical protein